MHGVIIGGDGDARAERMGAADLEAIVLHDVELVGERIDRGITELVVIVPAETTLVERDYRALKSEVLSRTRSSALVTQSFWSKAGDLSKNAAVMGCEPDYFAIKDWSVTAGERFDSTQERTAARVALLGHTVANDLFGASSPLGQRIMINRVQFTVIGVLTERGQGLDVSNEDSQIYVPLSTAMRRLTNLDHYGGIVLEIDSLTGMDAAAEKSRAAPRRSRPARSLRSDRLHGLGGGPDRRGGGLGYQLVFGSEMFVKAAVS